jgi:hypothetical protein
MSVLFVAISCHTTKLNPESYTGKQIIFGNGGGFAGAYREFVLQETGDLYMKEDINQDYVWVKRLDKNQTDQAFQNYTVLGIDKMKINKPGNMYYFVGMKIQGNDQKLVWGDEVKVERNLQLFYRILMHNIEV